MGTMVTRRRRVAGICAAFVSLVVVLVLLEVVAGVIWKSKYNQWLEGQLHGYDHVDYERSVIVPNPNTTMTVGRYREALAARGKTLGLKYSEDTQQGAAMADSAVLFRVNSLGFKGPEVAVPKPPGVFRILTIGDSCTWGPPNDDWTYPRIMERVLNGLVDRGSVTRVEVVNAGVYGYNFERVIKRLDDFLAVDPDLVTIYLGWNRTIGRADPAKNLFLYRRFALYRIYYHFVVQRADTGLQEDFNTKTYYEKDDPSLEAYKEYSFRYDMLDLGTVVRAIRERNDETRIVIVTLAGLYDWRVEPDDEALRIGYPIASTPNLYAYALLTRRYNEALRQRADELQLDVIDFERYAVDHLLPRTDYWHDSVHLSTIGNLEMGEYLASELAARLPGRFGVPDRPDIQPGD